MTREGLSKVEIEEAGNNFKRGIGLLCRMYFQWWEKHHKEYEEEQCWIFKGNGEEVSGYNLSQAAKMIGVTRQCMYYWIKKKWITPKRD